MKTGKIVYLEPYIDVSFGLNIHCVEVTVMTKTLFGRKKIVKGDIRSAREDLRIGDEVYFKLSSDRRENYVVKRIKLYVS